MVGITRSKAILKKKWGRDGIWEHSWPLWAIIGREVIYQKHDGDLFHGHEKKTAIIAFASFNVGGWFMIVLTFNHHIFRHPTGS